MKTYSEPNPPSRKDEDFPKTTTIPDGWVTDSIMEVYNRNIDADCAEELRANQSQPLAVPATGRENSNGNGKVHEQDETLFTRRLEPFTTASDLTGLYL